MRARRAPSGHRWTSRGMCAIAALLSGCSPGSVGQTEREVNAQTQEVSRLVDRAQEPMRGADPGRVSIARDAYIPADAIRSTHGVPLPAKSRFITVTETEAKSLPEIARILSLQGQIPVTIAPDMLLGPGGQALPQTAQSVSPAVVTQAIGKLQVADLTGSGIMGHITDNGQITPVENTPDTLNLKYSGPYTDLLDQIDAHFGGTWVYDGTAILLSRNITRTYTLHALSSNLNLTETLTGTGINSSSSGSGSQAGAISSSSQNVTSSVAVKVWEDVTNGVASIVGTQGKVAAILATGTMTVTAPPSVVAAVQEYINQQNRSLENEITVNVQVFTIQLQNSDTNSFDLEAPIKSHGTSVSLGNQTPGGTSSTGKNSGTSGTITPGFSIVSGGSKAAVQLLSQLGRVGVRTQASVTTMNGFVAPFQLTNTRNYVAQISTTTTPGGGTNGLALIQTTLVPGSVTTGFNISVLPRVDFADRTVLLQYGVSISALNGSNNGFDTFTSPDGTASVQLANVNEQNFVNNAEVPDGDTVVVTGYNNDQDTTSKIGAGTPGFWGLSGSQTGNKIRNMTVILITPTVIRVHHTPIETSSLR